MKHVIWIFLLLGCNKQQAKISPGDVLVEEHKDGKDQCAATHEFTKIIYNATHFDSALIQYPCNYNPEKRYPLFIYFHGLLNAPRFFNQLQSMVQLLLDDSLRVPYSFITICPKDNDGARTADNIQHIIDYAVKTWPVDTTHIYLTGISVGGQNVLNYLIGKPEYDKRIAAAVVMIPIHLNSAATTALTKVKTPVNFYTGAEDEDVNWCRNVANNINTNGGIAAFHTYPGGHCCTIQHYPVTDSLSDGKTIYDWLIQYHK